MAHKSDTSPRDGAAFKKRAKEPPYANLERTNSGKTSAEAKCSSAPAKSDEREKIEGALVANRTYDRLATGPMASREDSSRAFAPADGVRFREPNPQKQRVGMAVLEYDARTQDELTLKHGSMMEIVAEECGQEGWALARMDDLGRGVGTRVGIVPRHYVALMGSQPELVDRESVHQSDDFLGAGSYAEVFRGTYKGKEVALKLARVGFGEALKREALILSRLCHENIVQFFGMSLNPLFIVLELCEGGTLLSLYRKMGSSDVLTVIFWTKQVASALEHLHGMNEPLVYADMKAENVLIKQRPCECGLADDTWKALIESDDELCQRCRGMRIDRLTLKLADFNVSRPTGTKRDSCSGSMPWKSPDMMKQDAIAHPKMDIWSFGMFTWELLSRTLPDLNAIFPWLNKRVGTPLPLPGDLPKELRQIFDGCWRLETEERPTIVEVQAQLKQAEQCVDRNYKWQLDTVKQQQSAECDNEKGTQSEETADGVAVISISEQMVQMYMERVDRRRKKPSKVERMWAAWFPAPEMKRHKRPMLKLDKRSIGAPSGFRHIVSAKVGERTDNSGDKPMVIRYANADLLPLQRQQSHRSHDSLLECGGRECRDKRADEGGGVGYSTLPRTFKLQQQQLPHSHAHNLLPPPVPPQRVSFCRAHPCCAKKKMKSAKSNPELNNFGILGMKSGGGKVFPTAMDNGAGNEPHQPIRHRSPQPISRQHDYLSLLPSSKSGGAVSRCQQQQQANLCPSHAHRSAPAVSVRNAEPGEQDGDCPLRKDRAEPPDWVEVDGAKWDDGDNDDDCLGLVRRQYVNVPSSAQKAARRANAIRQRMVATDILPEASYEPLSGVTTPNDDAAEGPPSSCSSSAQLVGDANAGGTALAREHGQTAATGIDSPARHKGNRCRSSKEEKQHHQQQHNNNNPQHQQQQHELPELFNRRVSPPQQPHSLSPSAGGGASVQLRRATCGELEKSRRGELGHSTFYVDEPDSPSAAEGARAPNSPTATPSVDETGGGRRRSTAGIGGVHRSIASLLFKPLVGAKSSSSPRGSEQVEPDIIAGLASGITVASCFHPHHGTGIAHLCALSSTFVPDFQHGTAPNQLNTRPIEFVSDPVSVSAGRVATQRSAQHNPKFIKRADYPENQARQRHRTESASTAAAAAQLPHRRTHLISAVTGGGGKCLTTETGRQRRVSSSLMDTVIEMQHCAPPPSTAGGGTLNQQSGAWSARSAQSSRVSSLLNAPIPFHAADGGPPFLSASTLLLCPDHAALPHWHQRSRSSDSPSGKPPPSSNDLATLLRRQPVPVDGSIANPSYVPMEESAKNAKLLTTDTKVAHFAPPASQIAAQSQEERLKKPVPMPRTESAKGNGNNSARCPTSQAPVLNRAEMASECLPKAFNGFSMPVSEQCRPTTLRLGPPPSFASSPTTASVSLPTSASNSFSLTSANAQHGGGCDSGMCASSGNEGEGGFSPQTLTPPKGVDVCPATVFPSSRVPYARPIECPSSSAAPPRHFRPPPPCANAFPHLNAFPHFAPPPVPPKQQKEGPRVPPLPRNRRMMKQ